MRVQLNINFFAKFALPDPRRQRISTRSQLIPNFREPLKNLGGEQANLAKRMGDGRNVGGNAMHDCIDIGQPKGWQCH